MHLSSILVSLTIAGLATAADVKTLIQDASDIQNAVKTLDSTVQNMNGSNLVEDLALKQKADALSDELNTATSNVKSISDKPSEADAAKIFATLKATYPTIQSASARMVKLAPELKNMGVGSLAQTSVNNIASGTAAYGNALLDKTPASLKSDGKKLLASIQLELKNMVAAYS